MSASHSHSYTSISTIFNSYSIITVSDTHQIGRAPKKNYCLQVKQEKKRKEDGKGDQDIRATTEKDKERKAGNTTLSRGVQCSV